MKKLKKLCLRSNSILTDESMADVIGGYNLPDVTVYAYAVHTGDPSTCPSCKKQLLGTEPYKSEGPGMGTSLKTYFLWAYCHAHKGERCF